MLKEIITKKIISISYIALPLLVIGILSFALIYERYSTSWLMTLHSEEAEITEMAGETYLTIRNVSKKTVFFSDAPEREYLFIDTDEFMAEWDNLFADSPPNAAMVHGEGGVDTEIVVIELFEPVVSFDEISFIIKIIGGEYEKDRVYEDVNLFIDSFWDDVLVVFAGAGGTGTTKPKAGDPTPTQMLKETFSPKTLKKTFDPQENLKILAKAVNFDGWEESLQESLVSAVTVAANIGGDAGEAGGGGEKGRQLGSRVGAQLGITAIQTSVKAILRSDIAGDSSLDLEALTDEIKEAVESTAENFKIAYVLAENIINAQEKSIRTTFLKTLDELSAEYNKSIFCGASIDKDNVLFDVFIYYFRIILEGRIYYDLQSGMTESKAEADVILNLYDDVKLAILYSLWDLKDYCTYDENDLYTQLFYELYVFQFTATSEFPDLGIGSGVGTGYRPTQSTDIGYPTLETYQIAESGTLPDRPLTAEEAYILKIRQITERYRYGDTVGDAFAPEIEDSFGGVAVESEEILSSVPEPSLLSVPSKDFLPTSPPLKETLDIPGIQEVVPLRFEQSYNPILGIDSTPYSPIREYSLSGSSVSNTAGIDFTTVYSRFTENVVDTSIEYSSESGGWGVLDFMKIHISQLTENVRETFSKEVSTQYDIFTAEGFNLYGGGNANLEFITSDLVDSSIESSLREFVEDEAASGVIIGE